MSKLASNISTPESFKVCNGDESLPIRSIRAQTSFLQGKVLTVIDASYSSPIQNKAIKDLLKQIFLDHLRWMSSLRLRM